MLGREGKEERKKGREQREVIKGEGEATIKRKNGRKEGDRKDRRGRWDEQRGSLTMAITMKEDEG